ncbi:MAG: toxin-antitoxin system YwqK family antitoxin [Flavobacteriales bacterium]
MKKEIMRIPLLTVFVLLASFSFAQEPTKPTEGQQRGVRQRPTSKPQEADCSTDLEYQEKPDLVVYRKTGDPFSGLCRTYYEDNRLEREITFVDGKEDGISTTYYKRVEKDPKDAKDPKPGQIMVITEHKLGVPEGTWKYYFENGKLAWSNTYLNGKKEGQWEFFYENGKPKKEENWKADKKNGVFIDYFPSGKKKVEINYKDNKMHGAYKQYFENESVFIERNYIEGKEDGEEISYHKNGQVASIRRYKLGQPEGTWRTYFDDGKEKSVETYVKGKKSGEHKEFHREGQLKKRSVYVEGKLTLMEEFDEFGNKIDREAEKKRQEEEMREE